MVTYETLKVAGDRMDEAIIQYLRRKENILIGERTAEQIKITTGKAHAAGRDEKMQVKRTRPDQRVPKSISITCGDVQEALTDTIQSIVEAAKSVLERTPPELSADLAERGIVLAGGGASLVGLDVTLREETGVPVFIAEDPLLSVVYGVGQVLDDLDRYRGLLF